MTMLMLPMWISLLIRTYSLMALLDNGGIVSTFLTRLGFEKLTFIGTEEAVQDVYFPLRKKRDELARMSYLSDRKGNMLDPNDIYVLDIIRGGIKANDPRLQ